ncbi:methylase [Mycobacterium sp. IS-836]|uniref:methyltransferase domain-containing protein n=1 Tax=Mycobacterium sp. IS-836 TaxID=1834160 RepID=UPI00096CEBF6|nr:methyltransferase domain-containing protein [Mycobacterium sp. IS-836]OMC54832.1 methylase [Mycobacterium sp. IS-836]
MSVNQTSTDDSTYVLGHVDAEIQRLLLQGRLHNDFTEHALRLAGLRPGMRVLDVGCGPGDVSFIAARLVGREGRVLGVDAAADVIELARTRAADQGLESVSFEATAIADIHLDEPVDAVIGRLILMHLPDPVAALRHLAAMVRPGGLIVFCESDINGVYGVADMPLWRAMTETVARAFRGAGLDPGFGAKMPTVFRRAGLGAPRLTLGAPLGGADDTDIVAYVAETWRSMFPLAERLGLVPDELADLDTLRRRLQDEAAAAEAVVVMPPLICAWTQV